MGKILMSRSSLSPFARLSGVLSISLRMFRRTSRLLLALALLLGPAGPAVAQAPARPEPPVARALPVEDDNESPPALDPKKGVPPARAPSTSIPVPRAESEIIPEGRPVPKEAPSIVPPPEIIREGKPVPATKPPLPGSTHKAKEEPPLQGSTRTQADARTLYITLPAPRGMIVDRFGSPLAQNILAYYPAVQFPEGAPMKPADALVYAKQRILVASKVFGIEWTPKDEDILEHYQNRRWLPLLSDKVLKQAPPEELKRRLPSGNILHPAYLRTYPQGRVACHFLGSVGKVRPMPTGPLDPLDPFYPEMIGRDGLELGFDERLKGKAGQMNMLFDPAGNKINEEITRHPVPGDTLVTTLDLDFQRICEQILDQNVKRGAFVIIDVQSGDVLALASWPTFDLNLWVPSILKKDYDTLNLDKDKPLRGRAFMDVYPPASTFKVITCLAGLESGKLTEDTTYNCSSSIRVGNTIMHNWNTHGEGPLDMVDAIKRSCNTWFYRAGMATGSKNLVSMANRFGFGEKTGLPIRGEAAGRMANDEWMIANYGRRILAGDVANMSIGQGAVSATPLQVARAMAGIANGEFVPQLRLVSQFQDINNKVVEFFPPARRNDLNLNRDYIKTVHKGMRAVVSEGGGTGRAAANDFVSTAGKTGTAQWGPDRNMAWFAGFLPAKDPQYAFAAIYEGDVGEDRISGGKKVAPLVADVFNRIYQLKKEREEPMSGKPSTLLAKNEKKGEESDGAAEDEEKPRRPRAVRPPERTAQKPTAAPPPPPRENSVRGFFRRLFGKT